MVGKIPQGLPEQRRPYSSRYATECRFKGTWNLIHPTAGAVSFRL
jgi:hypothetical protein